MKKLHSNQSGLTIVELVLATAISSVLATVLLTISLTFFGDVTNSRLQAELAIESHLALQVIIEDVRLADSIGVNNVLADANQPVGGWVTDSAQSVLVINSPTTDVNNDIIYDVNTGLPYRNELIYFVDGATLYKRTLANSSATGNTAVTSCPEDQVTGSCPVDKKYSKNASDFDFVFYDDLNNVTTDLSLTRSAEITLTMLIKSFGKDVKLASTVYTTLRNY